MQEKDVTQKVLEKYNDVFADILNVLLFGGRNVVELLTLMSAMTGDNRFEETINDLKGKEKVNMCEVLDRVEARGIEKGIEKGRVVGRQEGVISILVSLVNDGILSIDEAAARANMSTKDFEKLIK